MADQDHTADGIKDLRRLIEEDSQRDQEAVKSLGELETALRTAIEQHDQLTGESIMDAFEDVFTKLTDVKQAITPMSAPAVREPLDAATARRDARSVEANADESIADTGVATDVDAMRAGGRPA